MAGGTWAAANVTPGGSRRRIRRRLDDDGRAGDRSDDESNLPCAGSESSDGGRTATAESRRQRGSAETAEAAIARLTASYSAAMSAVGALHKASAALVHAKEPPSRKQSQSQSQSQSSQSETHSQAQSLTPASESGGVRDVGDGDALRQLSRVASAARLALERAVILDPLVAPFAPTLIGVLRQKQNGEEQNKEADVGAAAGEGGAHLTSAAHRSSIRRLAYLSLVNYADLLVCCCGCRFRRLRSGDILDRGAVPVLGALFLCHDGGDDIDVEATAAATQYGTDPCECLWKSGGEPDETTRRLALVAYTDATELDKTDPALWFKVACAARALGRAVESRLRRKNGARWGGGKMRLQDVDVAEEADRSEAEDANAGERQSREPRNDNNAAVATSMEDRAASFSVENEGEDDNDDEGGMPPRSYRLLERHALERGSSVLPTGMPPNRAIARALREMDAWDAGAGGRTGCYCRPQARPTCAVTGGGSGDLVELDIDLPRYSWSMLGRVLMKACREGAAYKDIGAHTRLAEGHFAEQRKDVLCFGSPLISLRISRMLTLPLTALGNICEFLGSESVDLSQDIKNLESTCRALSVGIISARAALEQERNEKSRLSARKRKLDEEETEREKTNQKGVNKAAGNHDSAPKGTTEEKSPGEKGKKGAKMPTESHRSSKRVRSQLITSGKQAERSAKRKSVEYCLVSTVLSCSVEHPAFSAFVQKHISWDGLPVVKDCIQCISSVPTSLLRAEGGAEIGLPMALGQRITPRRIEVVARSGESSLGAFIQKWSKRNSGPLDVLQRFLSHVSLHVEEVFSCETSGGMVLSSCIIECLDLLATRSGLRHQIAPCWYGEELLPERSFVADEVADALSINVLNAELRFRRCERQSTGIHDYEDDVNALSFMVPNLLRWSDRIEDINVPSACRELFACLRARCHWLASVYYLWWSRMSHYHLDIRDEADQLGMQHLDRTMSVLKTLGHPIRTPHLESPGRGGDHWKELSVVSLASFRDALQASSVDTRARLAFNDIQVRVKQQIEGDDDGVFADDEKDILTSIGSDLLQRYDVTYEGHGGKHEELIEDFIACHKEELLGLELDLSHETPSLQDSDGKKKWGALWDAIPPLSSELTPPMLDASSTPSLLQILATCTQVERSDVSWLPLFIRVTIAAFDQRSRLLEQRPGTPSTARGYSFGSLLSTGDDEHFDSENSDESADSGDGSCDDARSRKRRVLSKERAYVLAACFLMDKIAVSSSEHPQKQAMAECFARNEEALALIYTSLVASAGVLQETCSDDNAANFRPDLNLFNTTVTFVSGMHAAFISGNLDLDGPKNRLESVFFAGLIELLVRNRKLFPSLLRSRGDNRLRRTARQKTCVAHADFCAAVMGEMADLLSIYPSVLSVSAQFVESHLIRAITGCEQGEKSLPADTSPLVQLTESLVWFWKYISTSDDAGLSTTQTKPPTRLGLISANAIDRSVSKRLLVPTAAVIIGLCGSAGSKVECILWNSTSTIERKERDDALSDFFDSDDSANGWFSDDSASSNERKRHSSRKLLLQTICRSIQCVGLVFGGVSEKAVVNSRSTLLLSSTKNGPLLPLVVTRVLSHWSDVLLSQFGGQESVWAEEYPYHTRSAGNQLDLLLYKAYRCLYGFTLAGPNHQGTFIKDNICSTSSTINPADSSNLQYFAPESTKAAAQLYRCIKRAYSGKGRRSPPSAALECVAHALPPAEVTEQSKAIQKFLFEVQLDNISDDGDFPVSNDLPPNFPRWVLNRDPPNRADERSGDSDAEEDELDRVRKGICRELASGSPIPKLDSTPVNHGPNSSVPGKDEEGRTESDEREETAKYEQKVLTKFTHILDDLCFNPDNSDGWLNLARCLDFKAELICDRLGLVKDAYNSSNFYLSFDETTCKLQMKAGSSLPLEDLVQDQRVEYENARKCWFPFVGMDLSIYIRHQWATFATLLVCAKEVGQSEFGIGDATTPDYVRGDAAISSASASQAFQIIQKKYDDAEYAGWERAWGGVFVKSLRTMQTRCLSVSNFLARRSADQTERQLAAEVSEEFGTACYIQLMGSTIYGFPVRSMTAYERRKLATCAKFYFQAALDLWDPNSKEDKDGNTCPWELHFMIGKCNEKIASTYFGERFYSGPSKKGSTDRTRRYESIMKEAMDCYAMALDEAKKENNECGLPVQHVGGSSHGTTEFLYRLHASRLKVLLSAVRMKKDEREKAELEALRVTGCHWYEYEEPSTEEDSQTNVRKKIWDVLADVVGALAQCRIEQPYFHRSVYRHAQALLWAPAFHDPDCIPSGGSLGEIPATKAYRLRGLSSGACAFSACPIIKSLFEKKRLQLVAVWVTTSSTPSPFEEINDATRKYDRLRSKYIGAFCDCMKLAKRKETLEEFFGWTSACPRDYPSFYAASAYSQGKLPEQPHRKESLLVGEGILWFAKHSANRAIAGIAMQELSKFQATGFGHEQQKLFLDIFRVSYMCYLRMNSSASDIVKHISSSSNELILEAEILCKCFVALRAGYRINDAIHLHDMDFDAGVSLLKASIAKCQDLFPSIAAAHQSRRKRMKSPPPKSMPQTAHHDKGSHADEQQSSATERLEGEGRSMHGRSASEMSKSPVAKHTLKRKKETKAMVVHDPEC